jgi:hypothetical protein
MLNDVTHAIVNTEVRRVNVLFEYYYVILAE